MTDTATLVLPEGKADHVRRAWTGELELREADGGPEVVGRIIPFGVVAEVADVIDGHLVRYRERFLPGCTAKVRQDADRTGGPRWVGLKLGHVETFDERVGYARSIEERDDGVWATFGLYVDARLDKVRSMLRTSHTGLSVEFTDRVQPTIDREAGLVSRRAIALHGVAATPLPQYQDAAIVAVRATEDIDLGTPNLERVEVMLAELDAARGSA
jgi:HK97 family phage prohead protease